MNGIVTPTLSPKLYNCDLWINLTSFLNICIVTEYQNATCKKYIIFLSKNLFWVKGLFYSNFESKTDQPVIYRFIHFTSLSPSICLFTIGSLYFFYSRKYNLNVTGTDFDRARICNLILGGVPHLHMDGF